MQSEKDIDGKILKNLIGPTNYPLWKNRMKSFMRKYLNMKNLSKTMKCTEAAKLKK